MLEDTAHDAVLARVNLNAYLVLVLLVGVLDSIGMYLAIFQLNAFSDLLNVVLSDGLVKIDMINFLLEELRMSQLAGQVAVVGEQQNSGSVAIQAPYGIDALGASVLDEIHIIVFLCRLIFCQLHQAFR